VYLGPWPKSSRKPPPETQTAYDARIAEWLAGGRAEAALPQERRTVSQLLESFWTHAQRHYLDPDGKPTNEQSEYKLAMRPVRHLYGNLPAEDFSPLKLKAVRQLMVSGYRHPTFGRQAPLGRKVINQRVGRIVRVWKWAVSEELVPETTHRALRSVRGLEMGRTETREAEPVTPVALAVVEDTLPFLNRHISAMVRLQLLTGMRPSEVFNMRSCDLDTSGAVWFYRPPRHKTAYKGKTRVIALGPKAQAVLRPFLRTDLQAYLFSPAEAEAERRESLAANRKTPISCGNRKGTNRKRNPKRRPGKCFLASSYNHAIGKAVRRANADALEKATEEAARLGQDPPAADVVFVPHWFAYQLRHTHATEVRRKYGLEAAQVALGHASADVTQVYAERDLTLAVRVAAEIG
jgi:integrase